MPKISILPLNIRNKIAAGEVVERPASVVKELIENSLDAESTIINIAIFRAGKKLIRVSDNGIGLDREDALIAFERYATSKIKNEDDLFNIKTMGFRGEALSSIASVSKVKMATSYKDSIGTCIEIINGEIKEIRDCSTVGTTIEVKDLFYNTPARLKFLKSDSTENYHIIDVVTKSALPNYKTGFFLKIDDKEVLSLPAASEYRERILHVFGKEFIDELIETSFNENHLSIKAFIDKGLHLRNNKNNQFIFINDRPIKDQTISYAVYKAYEGLIPKDKHPVFILFLKIKPDLVDFNVHPTKREVRFKDKNMVFNFVYHAIKEALKTSNQRSDYHLVKEDISKVTYNDISTQSYIDTIIAEQPLISENESLYKTSSYFGNIPSLYLGDTFIAITNEKGLIIIDYHALHERINYERLLKKIEYNKNKETVNTSNTSSEKPSATNFSIYRLLFPQQVRLKSAEYMVLLENLDILNEFGIEVDDFGHDTIIIRSIPEFLKDADLTGMMNDIAKYLIESNFREKEIGPLYNIKKALAARIACHTSIRGKEVPDSSRIAKLLKDLEDTENPDYCPHGRPTRIFLSLEDLRKMFKK